MRTKYYAIALLALMTAIPFCSGMVVRPVSGIVRDDLSGLPIPGVDVTVDHIAYPDADWHSPGEPEAYASYNTVTGVDGRYRTPWRVRGYYRLGTSGSNLRVRGKKDGYEWVGPKYYEGWQQGERNIWLVHDPNLPHEIEYEHGQAFIESLIEMPRPSFKPGSGEAAYSEFVSESAKLEDRVSLLNFLEYAHRYSYVKTLAESDPDFDWLGRVCELTGRFYGELDEQGRSDVDAIRRGTYAGQDTRAVAEGIQTGFDDCCS